MKRNISEKLESTPIVLPKSAFWEVFKRFGRDESISLVINVAATAVIAWFVNAPAIVTLIGPISRRLKDIIENVADI